MQIELQGDNPLYPRRMAVFKGQTLTRVGEDGGRGPLPCGRGPKNDAGAVETSVAAPQNKCSTENYQVTGKSLQPVRTPQRHASTCSHRNLSHVYKGITRNNRNLDANDGNAPQATSGEAEHVRSYDGILPGREGQ